MQVGNNLRIHLIWHLEFRNTAYNSCRIYGFFLSIRGCRPEGSFWGSARCKILDIQHFPFLSIYSFPMQADAS